MFKVVFQKVKRLVFSVEIAGQVNNDSTWGLSVCWKEKEKTCSETVEYLSIYCNDTSSIQITKTIREKGVTDYNI